MLRSEIFKSDTEVFIFLTVVENMKRILKVRLKQKEQ